jgi:hypothetical protein
VSAAPHVRLVARLLLAALLALPATPVLAQLLARSAGVALAADVCSVARPGDDGVPAPLQHAGAHCHWCCPLGDALPAVRFATPTVAFADGQANPPPAGERRSDACGMRPEARAPPGCLAQRA